MIEPQAAPVRIPTIHIERMARWPHRRRWHLTVTDGQHTFTAAANTQQEAWRLADLLVWTLPT